MSWMPYREQLRHPKWRALRAQILRRDGHKCVECGDTESTLHAHHRRYIRGRMAWEYEDKDLVTLCEACHGAHHEAERALKHLVSALPPTRLDQAVALLAGWGVKTVPSLDAEMQRAPLLFAIGEIAGLLDAAATMDDLLLVADALAQAADRPWTVRAAMEQFASKLDAMADMPKPPGFGESNF